MALRVNPVRHEPAADRGCHAVALDVEQQQIPVVGRRKGRVCRTGQIAQLGQRQTHLQAVAAWSCAEVVARGPGRPADPLGAGVRQGRRFGRAQEDAARLGEPAWRIHLDRRGRRRDVQLDRDRTVEGFGPQGAASRHDD